MFMTSYLRLIPSKHIFISYRANRDRRHASCLQPLGLRPRGQALLPEAGPADAPLVVLLHGFPSSSHMFRELIPLLATSHRVIAPDYPGFGHSEAPVPSRFSYTTPRKASGGIQTWFSEGKREFRVSVGFPKSGEKSPEL